MRAGVATTPSWEGRLLGIIALTLSVFGVAAVYGASSIWAVQNGQPGSVFALRQLIGVAVGLILLVTAARTDYRVWQRSAWLLIAVVGLLLLIPLLPFTRGIAPEINGARRWLDVGLVSIQPSEFAKFAAVTWAAMLAAKKAHGIREFRRGLLPFLLVLGPMTALILLQPDLSSAAVLAFIIGIVLFTAGARIGHFLLLGIAALPLVWHEITSAQYRLARMVSFLSAGNEAADASWQIRQSLIGIGAGEWLGVGFGEGSQKLGYLPYAYSDFIFSTIGEEWGFVGVALVLVLFAAFLFLGFRIARTAPDLFGTLLAAGLTAIVGVGAVLHIAVTLGLVPTTGITLPFLSYGRSNLLVVLGGTGVLISIARARAYHAFPP